MGFRIIGIGGTAADVDAGNNLKVTLPLDTTKMGGALMFAQNDDGAVSGTPYVRPAYLSEDYRLAVSQDIPLLNYTFNALTQDTGTWKHAFTTMTMTQSGGSLLLNANSSLLATVGCSLSTWAFYGLAGVGGIRARTTAAITQTLLLANEVAEFGLFLPTTTTAPAEGVWYQLTSAGLIGVLNYNGASTPTGVLTAPIVANQNYTYDIIVNERVVEFWRDDILLGEIPVPAANGQPFMTTALPFSVQFRNSGVVTGTAVQMKVSDVTLDYIDNNLGPDLFQTLSLQGWHLSQGQSGGTPGSTALYSNSLAAGAGTLMTNTTAALGTGLGGQFSALPTLAVGTDGIVCSYQNPVGGINQTPRRLLITRVRIQGAVTTILAGGPVLYAYSVAYGHTNVSVATAETGSFVTATAKAARRIPLGYETFAATAAVGTIGGGVDLDLKAPIVVNPGEFFAVCAKNLGVVTTTGVITFSVSVGGVWF